MVGLEMLIPVKQMVTNFDGAIQNEYKGEFSQKESNCESLTGISGNALICSLIYTADNQKGIYHIEKII